MKLVMQYAVGLEGVEVDAATKFGIKVARIPSDATGNAASCAEMAIYLMLGLLRKQNEMQISIKWRKLGDPIGETLLGKTINAGITTQLLLSMFVIEGFVHFGIAGNANADLHLADVVIPQYWAHTALWNWQRYGHGPESEIPLESQGDYTREIGYFKVANYTINVTDSFDNLMSNIWYQPEEVFPVDGTPEQREHAFWVPVDPLYYEISQKLENMKLEGCRNSTTCLSHIPKVTRVHRGTSASIYLDNDAYRDLLYNKFNITPVDMESASVALICLQQKVPFIVIRALSDLAGGGSANSNEADTFIALASNNSVTVVLEFVKHLAAATEKHLARCCGDEL